MVKGLVALLVYILFLPVAGSGQVHVKIEALLPGWADGAKVSLYSYQGYLTDTTRVKGGQFKLTEDLPGGDYYKLLMNFSGRSDSLLFYLDSGQICLNGLPAVTPGTPRRSLQTDPATQPVFLHISYTGSSFATDLNALYQCPGVEDQPRAGLSAGAILPPSISRNEAVITWILNHKSSAVSVFALDRYLAVAGRKADWKAIDSLYRTLSAGAKDNILALRLGLDIERNNTLAAGNPFPPFRLPDDTGRQVDNTGFKGRYLLIDFWASWCGPCREENKTFSRLAEKYRDKNFSLISITLDKSRLAWLTAVKADQLSWLQLSDPDFPAGPLEKALNLKLIPVDFIVSPEGYILESSIYGAELENRLDQLLSK